MPDRTDIGAIPRAIAKNSASELENVRGEVEVDGEEVNGQIAPQANLLYYHISSAS